MQGPLPLITRGVHRYSEQLHSDSPKGHVAHSPIRTPQGRHTTLSNIIPERCSILPGPIIQIIDCSEQALLSHPRQPAIAHVPPPVGRKDRSDGKSPPTISDSRLQAWKKISVITDISVLRFYGYIGDISAYILEKNIDRLKIVKNSWKCKKNLIII